MKCLSYLVLACSCVVGGLGVAGQAVNAAGSSPNTRTFKADKRYLVFP
jgi:hypothetical protein